MNPPLGSSPTVAHRETRPKASTVPSPDGVGAADAKRHDSLPNGKLRGRASSLNTLLFAAAFHHTHLPGEYRPQTPPDSHP